MIEKDKRESVIAEITLPHLLLFLNQEGRAFEMRKYMMQAGEDFITQTLLRS